MTIGTNDAIDKFGTQDTLGTSSSAVTDGAFSIAADLSTWTNDDDAKEASGVLRVNYSVVPDANSSINIFLRLLNIQGTNDAPIPNANFQHWYATSVPVNNVTTQQDIPFSITLPNNASSQEYEYYINPETGQTVPAGWDVFPTPKAIGPHA